MTLARDFVISTVVGAYVVPVYLAVVLLLKGMQSIASLVRPVAALVPDTVPAETRLSLLMSCSSASSSAPPSAPASGPGYASAWKLCSSNGFPDRACCAT